MIKPFPKGFLWGAATAAYQVEGAALDEGKGPSIWDVFSAIPGKMHEGDTGALAVDHYHRFREDIEIMRRIGLKSYRFSVSWPRVMPTGLRPINSQGLEFYDRLVDDLIEAGIEPLVTLYHWDLPAALQFEMGGWLHADIAHRFADYAEVVFSKLGDRVKYWLTLNEPWVVVDAGYFHGVHPPGVKDPAQGYQAAHNLLRAHAYAVARYRASKFGNGAISLALNTTYTFPEGRTSEDATAAQRAMETFAGWFGDPAWFGHYPEVMRQSLGAALPEFSDEDARLLRRSMDFVALNYYFSDVARASPASSPFGFERRVPTELPCTEMNWPIMPNGLYHLLGWLHKRYEGLPIYITENGAACRDEADAIGFVDDHDRIRYLGDHIAAVAAAIADHIDVRGYFVWSLMDNLEWTLGYSKRFGLVRCDRETLERRIKASGHWYSQVIEANGLVSAGQSPSLAC